MSGLFCKYSNASARKPRRRSPMSLRFGAGSRHNTWQLRLSTQGLSAIEQYRARARRTSVKVRLHLTHLWSLHSHRPSKPYTFRARDRADNVGRACGAGIFRVACLRARFELRRRGRWTGSTFDTVFHPWWRRLAFHA